MQQHAWMRMVLPAVAALAAAPSSVAAVSRGEGLFRLCVSCHGDAGQGNRELEAPAIAGLPEWYLVAQLAKFKDGGRGAHPSDLAGNRMRAMARTLQSQEDLEAVSRHVAGLRPSRQTPTVGGDPDRGRGRYAVCTACHGPAGEGMQALKAPPLTGVGDWYLVSQLEKFKGGIRGGDPARDATGAQMAPMARTLTDVQSVLDVAAYIGTLGPR